MTLSGQALAKSGDRTIPVSHCSGWTFIPYKQSEWLYQTKKEDEEEKGGED